MTVNYDKYKDYKDYDLIELFHTISGDPYKVMQIRLEVYNCHPPIENYEFTLFICYKGHYDKIYYDRINIIRDDLLLYHRNKIINKIIHD